MANKKTDSATCLMEMVHLHVALMFNKKFRICVAVDLMSGEF